ncbi:hypothetical protein SUGI_1133190 [Cryptomeria japonica]|nr:hypothetical protein SUGI_1133190 [Cryptomeria japonica]
MEKNMAADGQTHMLTSPSSDELAEGIAGHFLNPNIKTPITVGITGGCEDFNEKGGRIWKGVNNLLAKQNPGECKTKDQKMALVQFLEKYQPEHEAVYKSLACVELKQLMKDLEDVSKEKSPEIATRVLTVNFSARNYKGTLEAFDGLAVEITNEIEKSLTRAQRWRTF